MRDSGAQSIAIIDAADVLGDAVMSAGALRHFRVTAIARRPERVTRFSPAIEYSIARPEDTTHVAQALRGKSAVVLTLGHTERADDAVPSDETVTRSVVRAMREAGVRRLLATAPIDAFALQTNGMPAQNAPRRERQWRDAWGAGARMGLRVFGKADVGRTSLLDMRRAVELVRYSGLSTTLIAHPPLLVAPGPAPVTSVPLAFAPAASAEMSAANLASHVLDALTRPAEPGGEFVVSES